MSKEIIINVTGEHSRIAIVEDGELVELYIENPENVRTIGDIYLGRVRRILPGIKAAFVDIGQKQDAFLHFSDLSDNIPDLLELSDGKIPDWSKKPLKKAPKQDESGDSTLELETPEEQRAAKRRRDLQRKSGRQSRDKSRASRKSRSDTKSTSTSDSDKPSDARDSGSMDTGAEKSGRRRAETVRSDVRAQKDRHVQPAPPQPPVSDELPSAPPAILPEDAVAPPPQKGEHSTAPDVDATAESSQEAQKKRSRRGRRGGRGRRRGRSEQTTDTAQPNDAPDASRSDAEAKAPTEAKARDTKRRTKKKDAEASGESTPEDAAQGNGSARSSKDDQDQPRGRGRRSSQGRSKPSGRDADDRPTSSTDEASEPAPPKRTTSRSPRAAEERAPSSETTPSESRDTAKKTEPRPKKKAASARRSSRFVIDLTSKSGRVDRDDVEEEEEEEEKRSSRGRRGGRRRSRRRGKSSSSGSSNSGGSNSGGSNSGSSDSGNSDRSSNSSGKSGGSGRGGRGRSSGRSSSSSSSERPEKHLKQDQKLIVKIIKEPISSKGPRVSTDVSLAGRFLVLIPQADYVAVSKKIESSKERRRLRALARSLLPEGFGLIVRTVAENRDAKALDTDLRLLLDKWKKIEDQLRDKPKPPKPLYEDVNMVSSIIRDLFSEDYDRIVVDDPKVHKNVKQYVQAVAPQMAQNVTLHTSKEHVFRTYKIERDVRAAFETKVPLPGGGYLFIEHTEAMHVVDVNSGRAGRGLSQEENALRVNLESAREIAKQLRLRDLGGIICVDFIDMRSHSARQKVYDELKKEFRKDRAVTKLLPMSDFGVVEITRQRLRPSITTTTNVDDLPPLEEMPEPEPASAPVSRDDDGADDTSAPQPTAEQVVAHLDRWLKTYRDEVQDQHRKRPILIRVHPFLAAFLNRGLPSQVTRWRLRTRLKLRLDLDDAADPLAFSVRDEKSGKNLTRKYDPDRRDS